MLATNVRVALLCLLSVPLLACARKPRSGPTPSREVFAREWLGAWNSHDVDHTGGFTIRAVSVVRLEGDRIAWVRDYYDAYLLLSQLGIVPSVEPEKPAAGGDSASR